MNEDDTLKAEAGGGGKSIRPVEVTLGDDPDRRRRNHRLREELRRQQRMAERVEARAEALRQTVKR